MKKLFRYGYSSILAIIGLVVSFLTFSYYSGINVGKKQETLDIKRFEYDNEIYIMTFGSSIIEEFRRNSKLENIDITLVEQPIFIDDSGYSYTGDIVISGQEMIYPLVVGRYPSEEEITSGEKVVVLGQALKRYTKKQNGNDYITIRGDDYKVTGYMGCEDSVVIDHLVIGYMDCLGDGLYKDVIDYSNSIGCKIMLQSNSVSNEVIRELLLKYTESDRYYIQEMGENPKFYSSQDVSEESELHSIMTYIFSVILIILVIEYWLMCRKKEYAIRKAFGYSSDRLVIRIITELCIYMIIAIVISEMILAGFKVLDSRAVIFSVKDFSDRLQGIIRYCGITICILVIRPVYKIYTDNPIGMLVSKEKI